jgi:hypothetical protein
MQEITISGEVFKVDPPFTEGHVLTENQAAALNQTFCENIRNNMASQVKEAIEKNDFDQDIFQDKVTQYASGYEFGARRGAGAPKDPVRNEALKLAKKAISKALVNAYGAKHGRTAEQITTAAQFLLDDPAKGPKYLEQAKQIVEVTRGAADEELAQMVGAAA